MDENELLALIEKDESETVEFKKSTAESERALKAICAFLNHKGGTVFFGIWKRKIAGQEVSDQTLKSISQKIRQRIKPEVSPEINVLEIQSKKVIEVRVKAGNKLRYLDGIAYRRVGSENVVIPPDELERIILEKRRGHWDSEICEGATLEDVDGEKIRWFLTEARSKRGLDVPENFPVKKVLAKLKLMVGGKLTNAAVLLFGKSPQDFFSSAEVKCIRFKGNDVAAPMLDMKLVSGNLVDQVAEVEKFVFDHIRLESWIAEGKIQRQEKWEYPPKAVREAAVNAICHRDYASQSSSQVRVFDDRLEFWNPGSLPEGWTVETLRKEHESRPRNPLIAKQFFWIKYVEDVGSGTNKIISWCGEWGLPEPVFRFTGTSMVTTFRKPLPREEMSKLGLNGRQVKAVEHVTKAGSVTNREYQDLNNTTKRTATRDLADLVKKGVFNAVGRGRRELKYVLAMGQTGPKTSQKTSQNGDLNE